MSIDVQRIGAALARERELATAGMPFVVTDAWIAGRQSILRIEPKPGARAAPVDDSLAGARLVWGGAEPVRADVLYVDAEESRLVLDGLDGALPRPGETIVAYPPDFLTPLIDLWNRADLAEQALQIIQPAERQSARSSVQLPLSFAGLRRRQADALALSQQRVALLIGPPGTGKTYTIGAMIAHLLAIDPRTRILLTGPTNVAVDTALLAADDWLERIGRRDLRSTMKRIGSRFEPRKYQGRTHLLAGAVAEAAAKLTWLELAEPARSDIDAYAAWTRDVERARRRLWQDVGEIARTSRLVAVTSVSAFRWYDALTVDLPRFDVVIADEASQIIQPAAAMLTTFAPRTAFAGDPGQLAPVVQTRDARFARILARTAFDIAGVPRVQLDEQSRMVPEVCTAVSNAFYGGRLGVCRRALADPNWQKARGPLTIDGRSLARFHVEDVDGTSQWSQRYNGRIRQGSAVAVLNGVAALLSGESVAMADILVLTPFRAQRALLQAMARKRGLGKVRISTVHRSQGSESRIVLFDPVDADTPFLTDANGRRLINVAISRAKSHVVLFAAPRDLANPWLARLVAHAGEQGRRFALAPPASQASLASDATRPIRARPD